MKGFLATFASFLGIVASTGANTCSAFILHEPEIPECLRK